MKVKVLVFTFMLFASSVINSQELNATVIVSASSLSIKNKNTFNRLQYKLREFINKTKWTENEEFKSFEKIKCTFVLTLTKESLGNSFEGTLLLKSTRPVYNSTYNTVVLNHKDAKITFIYNQSDTFNYLEGRFESSLASIISYYVFTIIGLDADTYENNGGIKYHEKAGKIAQLAEQNNSFGWEANVSEMNRSTINKQLTDDLLIGYKKSIYKYHIEGLDMLADKQEKAKNNIKESILLLKDIFNKDDSKILTRMFIDNKANEIVKIFAEGPKVNTVDLVKTYKLFPNRIVISG